MLSKFKIAAKKEQLLLQFIKFGIVGLSNTLISYGVYAGLTYVGVPYVLASVIGFVVSVLNSFFWNNRYVFKKNGENASKKMASFKV